MNILQAIVKDVARKRRKASIEDRMLKKVGYDELSAKANALTLLDEALQECKEAKVMIPGAKDCLSALGMAWVHSEAIKARREARKLFRKTLIEAHK